MSKQYVAIHPSLTGTKLLEFLKLVMELRKVQKLSKEIGGASMNQTVQKAEDKVDNWIDNHVVTN